MNQKSTKTEVESEKQGEQFVYYVHIILSVQFGIASMVGAKKHKSYQKNDSIKKYAPKLLC